MKTHQTYQVRLYASRKGYEQVDAVLADCAVLYNAALEEWRGAYRATGTSPSMYDQQKQFTLIRKDDPDGWGSRSVQIGRGVLKRKDRACRAFYRRVKAGETPGYPRYKSRRRYSTIEIAEPAKGMVRAEDIRIKGLPRLRIRKGGRLRPCSSAVRSLSITRRGRRLYANIGYAVEREALAASDKAVGIDMGVSDRMALSDGRTVGRRRSPESRIRKAQRRLSSCRRGSVEWRRRRAILANAQGRERLRNRTAVHRLTTALVREHGLIAIEDLNIRNMTASARGTVEKPGTKVSQKAGLNRVIQEQTWGIIRQQLAYKAEWAGRELLVVDPRHTSQTCSECGVVDADSRNGKTYKCAHCGMELDADVNAAVVILNRAMAGARWQHRPAAVQDTA